MGEEWREEWREEWGEWRDSLVNSIIGQGPSLQPISHPHLLLISPTQKLHSQALQTTDYRLTAKVSGLKSAPAELEHHLRGEEGEVGEREEE